MYGREADLELVGDSKWQGFRVKAEARHRQHVTEYRHAPEEGWRCWSRWCKREGADMPVRHASKLDEYCSSDQFSQLQRSGC